MSLNTNPLNNPGAEHRSANAQERLQELGFEVEEAKSFIHENLESLDFIYEICLTYGIDTDMIAEILAIEGVDGAAVANYFAENGIDTAELGGSLATIDVVTNDDDDSETDDDDDDSETDDDDDDSETDDDDDDSETDDDDDDSETDDDDDDSETDDVVYDGLYSGTISSTSDTLSFDGILEATVEDEEIVATWSVEDLGLSGTLYGTVDNETGAYSLSDEDSEVSYGLTITGVTTYENSTGTWSAGFFSGDVETTFIG